MRPVCPDETLAGVTCRRPDVSGGGGGEDLMKEVVRVVVMVQAVLREMLLVLVGVGVDSSGL